MPGQPSAGSSRHPETANQQAYRAIRSQVAGILGVDPHKLVEQIAEASEKANLNRTQLEYLKDMTKVVLAQEYDKAQATLNREVREARKKIRTIEASIKAAKDAGQPYDGELPEDIDVPKVTEGAIDARARISAEYTDHLLAVKETSEEQARLDAAMYGLRNHHDTCLELLRFKRTEMQSLHGRDLAGVGGVEQYTMG